MKEAKFHGYSGNSPRLTNSILECQTTWKFAFSEKAKIHFFSSETHKLLKFRVNYIETTHLFTKSVGKFIMSLIWEEGVGL